MGDAPHRGAIPGPPLIAGQTDSPEAAFPVTVGPDLTSSENGNAFIAKMNGSGPALQLFFSVPVGDDA